jgi:hypothetical protein
MRPVSGLARLGAAVPCVVAALLVAGCDLLSGGVQASYLSPMRGGPAERIRVVAEAHADAGDIDRFALARIQAFTVTEVRLAKKFTTIFEGPSAAGDPGGRVARGRVARIVVTRYVDGTDGPNAGPRRIGGEVHVLDGPDVLAVYEVEKLAVSGPFIASSLRSLERGFAEKAARAILEFE